MMKAFHLSTPGGPEALKLVSIPIPQPKVGEVLIRIHARGLNRAEVLTRSGKHVLPTTKSPVVIGIEAVGEVASAPGGEFKEGEVVATAMAGGMGRLIDGSYAEYTCVPAAHVQAIKTKLSWELLAALPEGTATAWGSLFRALNAEAGQTLLIRGGSTSVGLAAATIAKSHGLKVLGTTRKAEREALLKKSGMDEVFIDNGNVAEQVKRAHPEGVDKVLELVGITTLSDSLRCAKVGGAVCLTGIVGGKFMMESFVPMAVIPTGVNLTVYGGSAADFMKVPLDEVAKQVAEGKLHVEVGKTFKLDDILEAHRVMEANTAEGKIVVLT